MSQAGKVAALVLLAMSLSMALTPAVPIELNGPSTNRIDITYTAEGFTASEMNTFVSTVAKAVAYRDTATVGQPYKRYRKFFNFYRIELISPVSGITHQGEAQKNTPLLGKASSVADRLGTVDRTRLADSVNAGLGALGVANDNWNHAVLNESGYFNSGGSGVCTFSYNYWGEIAMHEGGHSFHDLADEYTGTQSAPATEPARINVTINSTGAKWSQWLGYNQPVNGLIGAYEGGQYATRGVWRPDNNSKMNQTSQNQPRRFNIVCMEKMVLDIYAKVRPLDGWRDTSVQVLNPDSLWVKTVDPAVVWVDWYVDGARVAQNEGEVFRRSKFPLAIGTHKVRAHAYDEVVLRTGSNNASPNALDWVRRDLANLQQDVEWTVSVTQTTTVFKPLPAGTVRLTARDGQMVSFNLSRDGGYRLRILALDGKELASRSGRGHKGTNVIFLEGKRGWSSAAGFLKLDP